MSLSPTASLSVGLWGKYQTQNIRWAILFIAVWTDEWHDRVHRYLIQVMINKKQTHTHTHINPYTLPQCGNVWQPRHKHANHCPTWPLSSRIYHQLWSYPFLKIYPTHNFNSCNLLIWKSASSHLDSDAFSSQRIWFLGLRLVHQHKVCGCLNVCYCLLVSYSSSVCFTL